MPKHNSSDRLSPRRAGKGTWHFYRNVFSHVPAGKLREVALMLKAIHAQEDLPAAHRRVLARIGFDSSGGTAWS